MTIPDQPFNAEHRARVVAGIRALADLIEANTNLPVPDGMSAQYSLPGDLDDAGRQLVRDAAGALGIEPQLEECRAITRYVVAENDWKTGQPYFSISYTVHGNRPEPGNDTEAVDAL